MSPLHPPSLVPVPPLETAHRGRARSAVLAALLNGTEGFTLG